MPAPSQRLGVEEPDGLDSPGVILSRHGILAAAVEIVVHLSQAQLGGGPSVVDRQVGHLGDVQGLGLLRQVLSLHVGEHVPTGLGHERDSFRDVC